MKASVDLGNLKQQHNFQEGATLYRTKLVKNMLENNPNGNLRFCEKKKCVELRYEKGEKTIAKLAKSAATRISIGPFDGVLD